MPNLSLKALIDEQIETSRGMNLFSEDSLDDGDFVRYAQTYLKILAALKIDGRFHYAPGLGFIEQHLDRCQFTVECKSQDNGFDSVIIERIR